jgi:cyclopropane-fatty-acyl-phospholipid synthase
MDSRKASAAVRHLLAGAGITLNGKHPWDIQVHQDAFFQRVLAGGSLALGESYMDRWWDCQALDQFFDRVLSAELDRRVHRTPRIAWTAFCCWLANRPFRHKAYDIGKRHYDIGNDLFSLMLDRRMNYSCGYWEGIDDLDAAQETKLEMICRKLELEPGMRLLDIGCGWGALCQYAAEFHGVEAVGITVSEEQAAEAQRRCSGLPVRILCRDYREMRETFDRVVSVGMFEHVGVQHYRTYMKSARRCLRPGGLMLLHTIGGNTSMSTCDPWISTYIFPNSMLPSARQITAASEGLFVLEDWHSFGPDYDRTLMAWHANFEKHEDYVLRVYGTRFYRMWRYYLLCCAGAFRARANQLWQIVFSREGMRHGWRIRPGLPEQAVQHSHRHGAATA